MDTMMVWWGGLAALGALVLILAWALVRARRALDQLRKETEDLVRRRLDQSRAVLLGQVAEVMAPVLPGFPGHRKDARFLGQPVDYVVFDGLEEGRPVTVRLVEVKSGKSRLSAREQAIAEAVRAGRMEFVEYRLD